MKITF
jgi:hypothetical protein